MPSAISDRNIITKFTNCRLVKDGQLLWDDLWVSSATGKILRSQEVFYGDLVLPDRVIDLDGKVISPGLIDVQLNGAFGVDFSHVPDDVSTYPKLLKQVNKSLITMGVTSYLPTLTSQRSEVYHHLLPHLGPSGGSRISEHGSESLGAHCEGPFISPTKNGIHNTEVLLPALNGYADLEACYGTTNLNPSRDRNGAVMARPRIRLITAAPEVGQIMSAIPELISRDIIYSIGHSEATYEEASEAIRKGATMITHLFNAMRPLHHRNPGIFGVLGTAESLRRPFFGIIADGIHVHPTTLKIAHSSHPDGCILITDAMHLAGLPDGTYDWTNGKRIVKTGPRLTLEGSDKIAGSSISLIECVNNFLAWSGVGIPGALRAVTETPARMLGLQGVKGELIEGADADLVVLGEGEGGELIVEQVWKFGALVFETGEGGKI